MAQAFPSENAIMQICFVTENIEQSAAWFADLTGAPVPEVIEAGRSEAAQTVYMDRPHTAGCKLAFFRLDNLDIEFLEPGPEKSAWRDLLEERGPGCHHIAFRSRNLSKQTDYLEAKGHKMIQKGEFDGGGGRYAYFDTAKKLGVLFELLEMDSDREPQG